MENNTGEQHKKQNYDWLKGYQFVKGQSGNPSGRPKGRKSVKQFAKEYLEKLPNDEKIEFMQSLPSELIWKMAEGNPQTDITSAGESIVAVPAELHSKHKLDNEPTSSTKPNSEG